MVSRLTYPPPLDRLHTLDLNEEDGPAAVDYSTIGIGPADVPALIAIGTDPRYAYALPPAAWASVHAWRALGELRAVEAVEPLVALLEGVEDDDWLLEEVPRALGRIGAPAFGPVANFLADPDEPLWSRIAATEIIAAIAKTDPDTRDRSVALLAEQLEGFETQDEQLNSFLVCGLLDLDAVETAPQLERVFASGRIDLSLNGDWEDVQVELGLIPNRLTPAPNYNSRFFPVASVDSRPGPSSSANKKRRAADKRRRKMARQAKRRNRRKKK
jgi:hypothetical protein